MKYAGQWSEPRTADEWVRRGNYLTGVRRYPEAISAFEHAITIKPCHTGAYQNLGVAMARSGDKDGCVRSFGEAIRLKPKDAGIHCRYASALCSLQQYSEAIVEYQQCIKLDPSHAKAHDGLGNTYAKQRNIDAAVSEYSRVIEIDPNNALARLKLGCTLTVLGRFEEGREMLETSLRLDRRLWKSHYPLGTILLSEGKPREAAVHFVKALLHQPFKAILYRWLARALIASAFGITPGGGSADHA